MATNNYSRVMKAFGKTLKAAREQAGYSSAQKFAEMLGIEAATYRYYERGGSEPGLETLLRICTALGITMNDLFHQPATKQPNIIEALKVAQRRKHHSSP